MAARARRCCWRAACKARGVRKPAGLHRRRHRGRRGAAARASTCATLAMGGDLDLLFIRRFARLLREFAPDLVHVHSRRGADWLGGRAARRAGRPGDAHPARGSCRAGALSPRWKYRALPARSWRSPAPSARNWSAPACPPRAWRSSAAPWTRGCMEPAWSRERLAREFALDPAQPAGGLRRPAHPAQGPRAAARGLARRRRSLPGGAPAAVRPGAGARPGCAA